ncbi:MAG: UvrD-helicase domain-containing protein [Paludibacteraceae bacterium]|nr:UvrD-helicase domain-containing protein [Paludibacteraceae bacterium]
MKTMFVRKASAGSGKTFTLAAHYIALLFHGEHFQQILAVTFTNKATAEMKERILGYLYAIGYQTDLPSTQGFLKRVREVSGELGYKDNLTDPVCQQRAQVIHAQILSHYDEMRVQTIDTFLQSLLAGMVQQLNGAVGYQIELNIDQPIRNAVDELLTIGAQDPQLCKALTRYTDEQMDDEKNWDIRKGLAEIGKELYKESLQAQQDKIIFNPERLHEYASSLDWRKTGANELDELQRRVANAMRFTAKDFKSGQKSFIDPLQRLQHNLTNADDEKDSKKFLTLFTDTTLRKIEDREKFEGNYTCQRAESAEQVRQELLELIRCTRLCRSIYLYPKMVTHYINDMVLMGALLQRINLHLNENNTRLLATTANTLARALQPGDATFILEKAGIRYRHIMLDEFQDTSQLQWTNFEHLLREILASINGSTLIVGDIKQSIYRWRNGDWTIMRDLDKNWEDYYNTDVPPLVCNFRSEKEVVQFNLETMQHITANESDDIKRLYNEGYEPGILSNYYRKGHDGGYVQVRCYAQSADNKQADLRRQVRKNLLNDMFATIEALLARGVKANDIMILLRWNKEASEVLDARQECISQHPDQFTRLAKTSIISSSCFRLDYSTTVNMLVAGIRHIHCNDQVALYYLQHYLPHIDLDSHMAELKSMSLNDLVEYLLQAILTAKDGENGANKETDRTNISDLSYVNSFRDMLRDFVSQQGSDGSAFIRYWDDEMHEKNIPATEMTGIRLMSIHTSKGLEAKNVFIPFCDWKMEEDKGGSKLWCTIDDLQTENGETAIMPIQQNGNMAEVTQFAPTYADEHQMQRVDNFNLIYVAFTRAAERLYIYAPVTRVKDKESDAGQLIAGRCGLQETLNAMIDGKQIGGENDYAEVSYGDAEWSSPQEGKKKDLNPCSMQEAQVKQAHCYSSSEHIVFEQSQESRKYGWTIGTDPDEDPTLDQRALGIICHDILSKVELYATVEQAEAAAREAVDDAFKRGVIPNEHMREDIRKLVCKTVLHLGEYFTGDWHVMCEESILYQDDQGTIAEKRMDRVMWTADRQRAIVLDYKFGADNPKYDRQVRCYMDICRQMGAKQVSGYLWIADQQRLEQVSNTLF